MKMYAIIDNLPNRFDSLAQKSQRDESVEVYLNNNIEKYNPERVFSIESILSLWFKEYLFYLIFVKRTKYGVFLAIRFYNIAYRDTMDNLVKKIPKILKKNMFKGENIVFTRIENCEGYWTQKRIGLNGFGSNFKPDYQKIDQTLVKSGRPSQERWKEDAYSMREEIRLEIKKWIREDVLMSPEIIEKHQEYVEQSKQLFRTYWKSNSLIKEISRKPDRLSLYPLDSDSSYLRGNFMYGNSVTGSQSIIGYGFGANLRGLKFGLFDRSWDSPHWIYVNNNVILFNPIVYRQEKAQRENPLTFEAAIQRLYDYLYVKFQFPSDLSIYDSGSYDVYFYQNEKSYQVPLIDTERENSYDVVFVQNVGRKKCVSYVYFDRDKKPKFYTDEQKELRLTRIANDAQKFVTQSLTINYVNTLILSGQIFTINAKKKEITKIAQRNFYLAKGTPKEHEERLSEFDKKIEPYLSDNIFKALK